MGKVPNLAENDELEADQVIDPINEEEVGLLEEHIGPRKNLPPLLLQLSERKPEKLDYLGVSYGLTRPLLKFWTRGGFTPVYVGQVANNLTGEHTAIMIKPLLHQEDENEECSWLKAFFSDFRRRLVNLLGFEFRAFSARDLAIHLLSGPKGQKPGKATMALSELGHMITPYDLGRLKSFTNNMVEYRLIVDLVPTLAKLYFLFKAGGLENLKLSPIQKGILIGIGLQFKTVDTLASELDLDGKQLLGKFRDMMRQMVNSIEKTKSESIKNSIVAEQTNGKISGDFRPLAPLTDELDDVAKEQKERMKERLLTSDLSQYTVKGSSEVWNSALTKSKGNLDLISVKVGEKRLASFTPADEVTESVKKPKKT